MLNNFNTLICALLLSAILPALGQTSAKLPSFTLKGEIANDGKLIPGVKLSVFDLYHDHVLKSKISNEGGKYTVTFFPCNTFDSAYVYNDHPLGEMKNKDFPLTSDYFNAYPRYVINFSKQGYHPKMVYVNVYFESKIRDSILRAEGAYIFNANLNVNMELRKKSPKDTIGVLSWDNSVKTFTVKRVPHFKPKPEIKKGEKVILKNIFFETGSSVLLPASYPELNKLLDYLQEDKETTIEISGHTDNTGNETSNKELSKNRAKAVVDYLSSKGVSSSRVSFFGYGSSMPIASNESENGRQKNRRVEFIIK